MGAGGSNVFSASCRYSNVIGEQVGVVGASASEMVERVDQGGCIWAPTLLAGRGGPDKVLDRDLDRMIQVLFRLHDLNKNGVLEEEELIALNKKTAKLHHGKDVRTDDITDKYTNLFRTGLDPDGKPVPYETFRKYMLGVLVAWDPDVSAQKMIIEQLCAEAALARAAFHSPSLESASDAPYLPTISFDEGDLLAFGIGTVVDKPTVPCHPKCLQVDGSDSEKDIQEGYSMQTFRETVDLDAIAEAASTTASNTASMVVASGGSECGEKIVSNLADALKGAYTSLSPAAASDISTTLEAVAPKQYVRLKQYNGGAPFCYC